MPKYIKLPFISLALTALSLTSIYGGEKEFTASIEQLAQHISGQATLSAQQINTEAANIQKDLSLLKDNQKCIEESIRLSRLYEAKQGALFLNKKTQNGLPRKPSGGLELERAIFTVQQGLIDHSFTADNLRQSPDFYDDVKFETAAYFPGMVAPPESSSVIHELEIDASQAVEWGVPTLGHGVAARRPTGCYLAPGSVAVVRVPSALVGKGYNIRVGAHSWDLEKKPQIKRLDRVSIVYPITEKDTWIANPLGGGIYIDVPYGADAGMAKVLVKNALRSPYFSGKTSAKTTLKEWQDTERRHPGPWADFESDKFMMQVPTNWIYAFDDPTTLMSDWDKAMDAVLELFGRKPDTSKSLLYLQVDVTMRGRANFPGYPQSNYAYNPRKDEKGMANHWMIKGPQYSDWTVLHEVGHAMGCTKFRGEVEALVNLPYVAVMNKKFGVDLDTAFGRSVGNRSPISLDQGAIMWMVTENFRNGKPMNISNRPGDEVKYQHRGYAKYVEIAHLFGWEALSKFWNSVNEDYMNGITYEKNADPTDSRILRMSKAAGVDLTPLIHFWGIQPENPKQLASEIRKAGLKPSREIHDRLMHYKTIIPMNNADFRAHSKLIHPKGLKPQNPLYGDGWYEVWLLKYNETHGKAAEAALQDIIDLYFNQPVG